jgi:hypothetical protein
VNQTARAPRLVSVACLGAVCVLLLAWAYVRTTSAVFARPFAIDELRTVRYYTWAGVQPDGKFRRLRREEDFAALPRPSPGQFAIGLYCSLGRWPEPNNHVVNSFLTNFTLPLSTQKEWAARLPALAGGLAFAAAMLALCRLLFPSHLALPILALVSFGCPYITQYSQEARGYTWMLALQVLFLLALARTARSPGSLLWGFLSAALGIAAIVNVVTMAVTWVLPIYILLLLRPQLLAPAGADFALIRKNLAIQTAFVGLAGLLFAVDRLPFLYSSAHQYGYPCATPTEFAQHVEIAFRYLFPGSAWKVLAVVACLGFVRLGSHPLGRFVLAAWGVAAACSLLYFAATARLPYERVFGYLLPVFLLGYVGFFEAIASRLRSAGRVVVWTACLAATVWVVQAPRPDPFVEEFADGHFGAVVRAADRPAQAGCYPLFRGNTWGEVMELQLPRAWRSPDDRLPADQPCTFGLLWVGPSTPGRLLNLPAGTGSRAWNPDTWPSVVSRQDDWQRHALVIAGSSSAWKGGALPGGRGLVFWYLPVEAVAQSAEDVIAFLGRHDVRYAPVMARYQVKLAVYDRLWSVVLVYEDRTEAAVAVELLRAGTARFGGEVVCFAAHDGPG